MDNATATAQTNTKTSQPQYCYSLLKNIHHCIPPPTSAGRSYLTHGEFTYFHYKCDNFDDVGWGCAYRTLQSTCSWIYSEHMQQLASNSDSSNDEIITPRSVPTIAEIQQTLVQISDKPPTFLGSREWIGALEVFYVIDTLYGESCKILHIPQSEDIKRYANVIKKYFEDFGGFIMMGGDVDASSKGIAGIHICDNQAYLLVIDPHYVGPSISVEELVAKQYVRWQHTSEFVDSSFYNLCLPQLKAKNIC